MGSARPGVAEGPGRHRLSLHHELGPKISSRDVAVEVEGGPRLFTVFRVRCSCGWASCWWASVAALLADVHGHRHGRRRAARVGGRRPC